jgi:hypothetical protein
LDLLLIHNGLEYFPGWFVRAPLCSVSMIHSIN